MTRIGMIALRTLLAAAALAAAGCWLPLLDAEPVSRLDDYPGTHPAAPAWAQSFSIVGGRFVFDVFATPRETPLAFCALTVIMVVSVIAFYLSFTAEQRGAFLRLLTGRSRSS